MTRPSEVDAKLIERFLRTQQYRHAATAKNYAGTLRNFSDFIAKHNARSSLTVSTLQKWLKERSAKWPAHILYHRTFLIERYLTWLQVSLTALMEPPMIARNGASRGARSGLFGTAILTLFWELGGAHSGPFRIVVSAAPE